MAKEGNSATAHSLCKFKFEIRSFYSKGAFLVLLWSTLNSVTLTSKLNNLYSLIL